MSEIKPKIALVHDFLLAYGGAERVLQALAEMYPEAPIYTLLADHEIVKKYFPGQKIRTSFLQRWPRVFRQHYRWLLPFYPVAVESFDLRDYDVVISSSGAWSKGIVTRLYTKHIAYVHSPMRFAWEHHSQAPGARSSRFPFRSLSRIILSLLRVWDREAAERPDILLANSRFTQERIAKYYRRSADIVSPPALRLFERYGDKTPEAKRERTYFLVVARLTRNKRVDTAIEAFNKLELPLVIVGTGPDASRLRKLAGPHIHFRGLADENALATAYREARALIQPSEEDFGLVAVEALSFGTPVIALGRGGARELVQPGVTGEFFEVETSEVLADGVRRFVEREGQYDRGRICRSVDHFSTARFRTDIETGVAKLLTKT